jgi:hypothetical protein
VKWLWIFVTVSFTGCCISWQCCNHPYIIEESLQPLLLKGLEEVEYPSQKEKAVAYLNVGIKASGKLQLLDSMLTELRKNKLRALILFQVCILQTIFPYIDYRYLSILHKVADLKNTIVFFYYRVTYLTHVPSRMRLGNSPSILWFYEAVPPCPHDLRSWSCMSTL